MTIFYYLFFIIIFSAKMFGFYDGQPIFYACVAVALLFYVLKILTSKHSIKEYIVMAFLFAISGIAYILSGEKGMILFMAMLTGMKGVDSRKVIRFAFYCGSIIFVFMTLITCLGIIPDGYHVSSKYGTMMLRRYFGQPGANVTHTILFLLVAMGLYLDFKTVSLLRKSVLIMILNVYLFMYTFSLTGVFSITFLIVINLILAKIGNINTKKVRCLSNILFGAIIVSSIILPLVLKGKAFEIFNKIMNHRIEYAYYYLINQKISLLGSRLVAAPDANYYLDNAYLYLFLNLGIALFAVIVVLLFFTLNKIISYNNRAELAVFTAFAIIGISDPFLFNASFKNIIFVFAGQYLYQYLSGDSLIGIKDEKVTGIKLFIDKNMNLVMISYIVIPLIVMVIFYIFPDLYNISLFAAGDRLAHYTESEINLNKEIDTTICVLRSGVYDGLIFATILNACKWLYDVKLLKRK